MCHRRAPEKKGRVVGGRRYSASMLSGTEGAESPVRPSGGRETEVHYIGQCRPLAAPQQPTRRSYRLSPL